MRLTLRTLLAYMDDILEPNDHEDLGQKIEASDFAAELIHRSRDAVRRLRLGAPAVLASGSDDVLDTVDLGDANSVAEYLDNTLPPEQVADFERMCLEPGTEPDMHLAEVASCHHVLTMVLGEPADVDADLKTRMYQLPNQTASGQRLRIEAGHVVPVAAPPLQPVAQAAPLQTQPAIALETELPDYLREAAASKRRGRRWAIAMTSMAAVGALFFWLAVTPESEPPAEVAMSGAESFGDNIEFNIDVDGSGDLTTEPAIPAASEDVETAPLVTSDPTVQVVEEPKQAATDEIPKSDSAGEAALPAAETKPEMAAVEPPTEQPATAIVAAPPLPELPGSLAEVPAPDETSIDTPEADTPEADVTEEEPLMIASVPGTLAPELPMPEVTEEPAAAVPVPTEPVGPRRMGSYTGNNDVLLIYSAERDKWIRMPPRSPLSTGDVLLTLPKFRRTHVVLADVNMDLYGGTRVRVPLENFEASTGESEWNLEVVYGRLLISAGLKGSQAAMQVDDQLREFRLDDSASLAVEVQRIFVAGSDYENEAAPIKATWYLTSGSVVWPTAAGGTQTIQAPAMWQTIDGIDEIPEGIEQLPAWIDHELVTDVERRARDNLAGELAVNQAVNIRLLELTDGQGLGRQKEVRILAAAASVFVGEFEPLVKALNDSDQKRAWETHIHDLRQALALSPDVAARVRQDFVNIRGEEAARDLMEMVIGYSAEQIGESREMVQSGALAQLINWLDHDSLDYRVLAIHNIREITGKIKGYRPDDISKRRKINLRKLWDEFETNELLPRG